MTKSKRRGRFFVYILRCSDQTFYTGYTPDLKRRIARHNQGQGSRYTRTRLPVQLVWFKEYHYFKCAFLAEIRLKKLSRRQKEKLITQTAKKNILPYL